MFDVRTKNPLCPVCGKPNAHFGGVVDGYIEFVECEHCGALFAVRCSVTVERFRLVAVKEAE